MLGETLAFFSRASSFICFSFFLFRYTEIAIPIRVKTAPTAKAAIPEICSGSSEISVGNPKAANRHMDAIKHRTPAARIMSPGKVELLFESLVASGSCPLLFLRASIVVCIEYRSGDSL